MELFIRELPFEIPKYSLTGDVLSFLRCGRQYRYYNGSALPPSRPVQLWTGEFIHGVMEEAYLYWLSNHPAFPWPCTQTPARGEIPENRQSYDIGEFGDRVERKLAAGGKTPRSTAARNAAYARVKAAINVLGPYLFPLITSTEQKLSGTVDMPEGIEGIGGQKPRGDRYELTGIVDVISHVSIETHRDNPLVQIILSDIPELEGSFDIIVDYKAARRPLRNPPDGQKPYWEHQNWQVQTYAWLRQQQIDSVPVKAAILININELFPSSSEIRELLREIDSNQTDVVPQPGTQDYYELYRWTSGTQAQFTEEFLLKRAIRVVKTDDAEIASSMEEINRVITSIELCALNENATGNIPNNWLADGGNQDCDACDFRRFCVRGDVELTPPRAPG